jgi:hypothetical protein
LLLLGEIYRSWIDIAAGHALMFGAVASIPLYWVLRVFAGVASRLTRRGRNSDLARLRSSGSSPTPADVACLRRLLVLQACICRTTTGKLGADHADQYRAASTAYLDLAAILGVSAADAIVERYPSLFSRIEVLADQEIGELADDLEHLGMTLTARHIGEGHPNLQNYAESRLDGFLAR